MILQGRNDAPIGDPGPVQLFSVSVYYRGAATLAALRQEIGDKNFFELLRTYMDTYAGGHATTEDFIALAESISGADLSAFFDAWLYQTELPDLDLPLIASATCRDSRTLVVNIVAGNGPFDITADATSGKRAGVGPFELKASSFENVTVTETHGDGESINLGTFECGQ